MNQPDWARVEDLFDQATALPAAQLAGFLDQHCNGDGETRREVEALLAADPVSEERLRSIVLQAALEVHDAESAEAVGRRIGPYVIERETGRGGMGIVYLAFRDDDQFRQRVAIKVVSRGMDSEFGLTRFRRERQVLADLQHANIARLLDGGATSEGLPYFAMEYLEGHPITEYCQRQALETRARVELFLPVCAAVQYAHSNLVIHRDLKPGNILVTEDGVPKLLDFGIATLIDAHSEQAAEASPMTERYASPEQIRGREVTTAADVFSLGAVLQELLAKAPSPPAKDLAAIVRKAMHPEPQQRYESAGNLADDLRRWLVGRPVRAFRGGVGYRTARFVDRHKFGVAAALAAIILAAAGLALYLREAHLSQRRFQDLHKLANSFVFDFDDKIRSLPGSTRARAMVVQKALEYLNPLAAESGGDEGLEHEVANAYRRVGDLQGDPLKSNVGDSAGARTSYAKSIAILEGLRQSPPVQRDLVRSYIQAASLERVAGDRGRGMALLKKAQPIAEAMAASNETAAVALLADVHEVFSRILVTQSDYRDYLAHAGQSVELYERLAARDPKYLDALASADNLLASGLMRSDRLAEALEKYRRNLALRERMAQEKPGDIGEQRNLMISYSHVADTLGSPTLPSLGDTAGAVDAYRRVLAIATKVAAADPTDRNAQIDVVQAEMRLGSTLTAAHQPAEAMAHLTGALRLCGELLAGDPRNLRLREANSFLRWRLAVQLAALGQMAEARKLYADVMDSAQRMLVDNPRDEVSKTRVLIICQEYAALLAQLGERKAALTVAGPIPALAEQFAPTAMEIYRVRRPHAYAVLAGIYEKLGDRMAARESYAKSVAAWEAIAHQGPLRPEEAREAAEMAARLGR